MVAFLVDHWLAGRDALSIHDQASVAEARELVRREAQGAGLSEVDCEKMAIVASELGHNQLAHAVRGRIATQRIERAGVAGLELMAVDEGAGIADAKTALAGEGKEGSLGIGLSGVRRLALEVDFDVRLGSGSAIWARLFAGAVPRRREVGIYSRPIPGEATSGDHALFVRRGDRLLLAIADGLGHGPSATEAAVNAIDAIGGHSELSAGELLSHVHQQLAGTRGAVMAIASIDEDRQQIEYAGIGDTRLQIVAALGTRALGSTRGILGQTGAAHARIRVESDALSRYELVSMFTDGLATRTSLEGQSALLTAHPLLVAQHLLSAFGRATDDALVIVAR